MEDASGEACRAPGGVALLIVDMINDLAFEEAGQMLPAAMAAAQAIAGLRAQASRAGVPVIYINDNYGIWHSERSRIVEHCAETPEAGQLIELLRPDDDDLFVIKPRFSGFYATNLPVLLPTLGATRLILTGVSADICVLFTAADAHMREYELWVPSDCVASFDPQRTRWALEIMEHSMSAETHSTAELALDDWVGSDQEARRPPSPEDD